MVENSSHIVIYSHGFGMRKTNRGLFAAIAKSVPEAEHVMFDYNPINDASNTLTVKSLQEQTLKLRKVVNTIRAEQPDAVIDLVCHDQGCIVAGLLKPRGLRKVIMLAPPDDVRETTVAEQLGAGKGIAIDVSVRTRLLRSDGSTTVIHPGYWQSLAGIIPVELYNRLSRFTGLRIISARQDQELTGAKFDGLDPAISRVVLDGNHYFDDEADRKRILFILQKELTLA